MTPSPFSGALFASKCPAYRNHIEGACLRKRGPNPISTVITERLVNHARFAAKLKQQPVIRARGRSYTGYSVSHSQDLADPSQGYERVAYLESAQRPVVSDDRISLHVLNSARRRDWVRRRIRVSFDRPLLAAFGQLGRSSTSAELQATGGSRPDTDVQVRSFERGRRSRSQLSVSVIGLRRGRGLDALERPVRDESFGDFGVVEVVVSNRRQACDLPADQSPHRVLRQSSQIHQPVLAM